MNRRSGRYSLADYLTQGYIVLVGLIVLAARSAATPVWPLFLAGHVTAAVAVHFLIRAAQRYPGNRVAGFFYQFYPMLLYGPFFWETSKLNHVLFGNFIDPLFIRTEAWIFGFQPGLDFMGRFPYRIVSEVLYASYFSYYLMISAVALALYLRRRAQFQHYVVVASVVFYFCYLCYIFLPVVGPLIYFPSADGYHLPTALQPSVAPTFPAAVQGGPFFKLMGYIYVPFEAPGASFPSSHVAVAVVTLYFSFKYLRTFRWLHLFVVLLLCASTVYGRYHYVVDVAGGLLCAAIFIPLGNRLYAKFGSGPPLANPPRAPVR